MNARRPGRNRTPQWKIFTAAGVYMGSLHDATDAAILIANYDGGSVRYGHEKKDTVWTQGVDGDAGESFDTAVELMLERLSKIGIERRAIVEATTERMKKPDWWKPGV